MQVEARQQPLTVTEAYLQARAASAFSPAEWLALDQACVELEYVHQRWKTTHVRLATRMLGDATGSGYTAGVPYLRAVLGNRLFWGLPALAGTAGPAGREGVTG